MSLFNPPRDKPTQVFTRVPDSLRRGGVTSDWAEANKPGATVDCFLEGPSFDREGNLWVTDIPFGRVFKITPDGGFHLVTEYDGWPNGLKFHRDGRVFITDYKNGLVVLDPDSGAVNTVLGHRRSEAFKGVNDLVFASNGDIYFTDQGQTGLHDPTGRVYRYGADGHLEQLIGTIPSPNGIVLDPAERIVYVAVTRANAVWRMPLMGDGGVSKVGLFLQLSGGFAGPDGMAVDIDGNIAVCQAGMGSVWLFSRMGEPIYRIRSSTDGLTTTNCAYGGPDNKTLYITESDTGSVLQTTLDVPGQPMFSHH